MSFKIKTVTMFKPTDLNKYPKVDEVIALAAEDGRVVELKLTGDCCSGSYFEEQSIKDAQTLVGQTLFNIENAESARPYVKAAYGYTDEKTDNWVDGTDAIHYHCLKLTTDQGVTVLDWRNESNGYYDGTCRVSGWFLPNVYDDYADNIRFEDMESTS